MHPRDNYNYSAKADVLVKLGRGDEAVKALDKAIEALDKAIDMDPMYYYNYSAKANFLVETMVKV